MSGCFHKDPNHQLIWGGPHLSHCLSLEVLRLNSACRVPAGQKCTLRTCQRLSQGWPRKAMLIWRPPTYLHRKLILMVYMLPFVQEKGLHVRCLYVWAFRRKKPMWMILKFKKKTKVMKIIKKWKRIQYCRWFKSFFPLLPDSLSSTISKWVNQIIFHPSSEWLQLSQTQTLHLQP